MAPSKAQGQAPASAPAPAPAPAPARAPTAATPANSNAFAVKKSSAAPNNVRKRVEPAIPLTFLRRPKATAASSPLPASPSPLRNHNKNTPPSPKQAHLDKSAARPQSDPVAPNTNGHKVETEASFSPPKSEQGDAGLDTVQVDDISAPPSDAIDPQLHDTPTQSQVGGETTPPDTAPTSTASFPQPSLSPPPIMPPPGFYPAGTASNGNIRASVPDPIRLPSHPFNPPRMHQQNLSNGSMIFGGFQGSNQSASPVPHSGGAYPPPMPVNHGLIPVTRVDTFGRPMVSMPPTIDTHPAVAMNQGPLTPHSFHGSQSSRNEDFASKPMVNGTNGINGVNGVNLVNGVDAARPGLPPGGGRPPYHPSNQPPFGPDGVEVDEVMDFAEHFGAMFARPEFADCEIVLAMAGHLSSINSQYPGAPNGPLRFPAHQIVLSRHRVLRDMIFETSQQTNGPREIRIVSDDPFLRPDAMWRAIKYMYGCRYVPIPQGLEVESDVEKFHFALAYAAAGARLEVPNISVTAVREAAKLLSWDTIEKGLEFALTGMEVTNNRMHLPHAFPHFRYKHGSYVGELVEKMVMFLVTNFPDNFVLDPKVDNTRYSRLPAPPASSHDQAGSDTSDYQIQRASQPASRMANINIKFGDMDPNESNGQVQDESVYQDGGHWATLSRILLNLPYEMLKFVLESNSHGGVPGWRTAQDRRRVMAEVIAQREMRRLRLVGELAAGRYQGSVPMEELRCKEPRLLEGTWSSVCWREECLATHDVPIMGRTWSSMVPLVDV